MKRSSSYFVLQTQYSLSSSFSPSDSSSSSCFSALTASLSAEAGITEADRDREVEETFLPVIDFPAFEEIGVAAERGDAFSTLEPFLPFTAGLARGLEAAGVDPDTVALPLDAACHII